MHVSITNPSIDSPYPYFRGKALVDDLADLCVDAALETGSRIVDAVGPNG